MIGGNVIGLLQSKTAFKNSFGEVENSFDTSYMVKGYLDYMGGDASYKSQFKGALEQTTHLFIADYVAIENGSTLKRMIVNNKIYEVLYIDNPMELNDHLEIFLKYLEVVKE